MRRSTEEIDFSNQTLIEHLTDLRVRLIRSLIGIFIGMLACYNFSEKIFEIIRAPIAPYLQGGGLVFTAPMDKFMAHLKISFFAGLVISCPWWMYQVWKFISPGLYNKEKKFTVSFIVSGSTLFIIGVLFSYYIVFPTAFNFLMGYGGDVDKPMITIDQYLSFFLFTAFMFGISFELPLILVILGMLQIIDQKFLREKRRFAIVGLAVISAILTPPDLLSMVMMLGPMVFLYEVSIILVGMLRAKKIEENI